MLYQQPRWLELGAFLLTLNAGFINAIGLLGFSHQAISHLTGNSTLLSLAIAELRPTDSLHLLLVMLSFVLGAAYSGLLLGNSLLTLGRGYSLVLLSEALLLFLAWQQLQHWPFIGHCLASAACGVQNAMTSTYSGAVMRTTHVSGLFTDLGIALGLRLRGQPFERRKLLLYLLLISGFSLGGILGAFSFAWVQFDAMQAAGWLTLTLACGCWLSLHYCRRSPL